MIKKLYYRFVPFSIRVQIGRIKHRKEINFSKTCFERQEIYFKRHIDDFVFDDARKADMLRIFSFLRKNGCVTFPEIDASISAKYFARKLKIEKDSNTDLFYVLIDNKKLFYKNGMDEVSVRRSFNSVSLEQDYASPHRYLTNDRYFVGVMELNAQQFSGGDSFGVNEGDVVVDGGAAEGNFALSVIDKASKVYIVEGDAEWCEALRQTFLPYGEKVEIIQKYLSDNDDDDNVSLVNLVKQYRIDKIDFLKLDVEGYEKQTLRGSIMADAKFVNVNKMSICVYHNPEDEAEISNFVSQHGYKSYLTNGYIVFPDSSNPPIRKAVLRAYR
jgi:hypothetical protein